MIIVLCGVRGSGKDTVGDILRDQHGFKKEAFANPLKEMVKHAFPAFTDEDLYGPSKNREREYREYPFSGDCVSCGFRCQKIDAPVGDGWVCPQCGLSYPEFISPRTALQQLGTGWGRRLYENVWIDAAFERIKAHQEKNDAVARMNPHLFKEPGNPINYTWVITDGRFLNEVQRSRELGAVVVKLTRKLAESTDAHASEAEFRTIPDAEFDYVFDNATRSLEQLPDAVEMMLALLTATYARGKR